MQKKTKVIRLVFELVIIAVLLVVLVNVYKNNNFNEYIRAEQKHGLSKFSRDGEVKYSNMYSYKIENIDYTDSMFYKNIKVKPNTPYKVTCMVKTKDVRNKIENADAGVHISINGSIEKSNNIIGTTDWTKLEFVFNSKNRENVEIGFRLGGYESDSIGTAWFSDINIESGVADVSSIWNFLCLIFDNTDVNVKINGSMQNVKVSLTNDNVNDMKSSFERFKSALGELSLGKITANGTIIELQDAINSMTYSEENDYFVAPNDISNILDKYIEEGKYDHIFAIFKTGDINKNIEIPTSDWIGLGSMEYRNIGFSNIRVPSDKNSYIYKYDTRVNTFPEEVFIHEFLHTLEKNALDYGYDRPELHDYQKYGYENKALVGLKAWYEDYMNSNIKTNDGSIGLPKEIYNKKPTKTTDFTYIHKLNDFKEPENVIEELNAFVYKITNSVNYLLQVKKN